MVRIETSSNLPWLDGPLQEVSHQLGQRVAIWRIGIPTDSTVPSEAVSDYDRVRAERIRDQEEKRRFLACQALLRHVLAQALGLPLRRLAVIADERGKPRLAGDPLRFNTSRSGADVLIGISEARDIGVDIERVRELPDVEGLARHHLSPGEREIWQASEGQSRNEGFLSLWTRKEACVKATGMGLAVPLALVHVCQAEQAPFPVTFHAAGRAWALHAVSLPMPRGLVAAAALCI